MAVKRHAADVNSSATARLSSLLKDYPAMFNEKTRVLLPKEELKNEGVSTI